MVPVRGCDLRASSPNLRGEAVRRAFSLRLPRKPFVLGLDWISSQRGWAYCRADIDAAGEVLFGSLGSQEVASSNLIQDACRIVVDAPIGLREPDGASWCALRACDRGARRWVGPLWPSIFPSPVTAELADWRHRRSAQQPQLRGHARGLLPAIDSAEALVSANPQTLESHPEVVFAALAKRPLPSCARKTLLLGLLARLYLLRKAGIALTFHDLSRIIPAVSTDNYLDAAAMSVVARSWSWLAGDLEVIRRYEGLPERLGNTGPRAQLIALPGSGLSLPESPPLSAPELVGLARRACAFPAAHRSQVHRTHRRAHPAVRGKTAMPSP